MVGHVSVLMVYKRPDVSPSLPLILAFFLGISTFSEWAMLGSNQRPLPCESSAIVCWRFLEFAKLLPMDVFGQRDFSQ